METTTSSVINKMTTMDDNPLEYDDLIDAWNTLCEQSLAEYSDDFQFAEIENAAILALSDETNNKRSGHLGSEISRMLSTFDYPTFLVSSDGRVAAINSSASIEFDLGIGDKIDQLPYSLDTAQTISKVVKESLHAHETVDSDAILKRAFSNDNDRQATIAITSSAGRVPTSLVFVITTKWKPKSTDLLQRQFDLTSTETELLVNLIDGYSSQDIAKLRNRSHATVRTQLQSILTKTGARNQTELLRMTLSVSDFVKNIGLISDAVNHPHRRCAEILRKGGRRVEVTLMGDLSGDPIVTVAQASHYRFNAEFEQYLFGAKLYVISICPPGYGKTDPVPKNESRMSYIEKDMEAILDQLGVKRCPALAINTNGPIIYALANSQNSRLNHVVQISTSGPIKYANSNKTLSPWVTAAMLACTKHGAMKRMIIRSGIKAWVTLGASQFMRFQMSNPIDAQYVFRPENIKEYDYALKNATRGGLSAATTDTELVFGDWSDDIDRLPVGITIVHGDSDQVFTIESVRSLTATFAEKITLIEIKDAGYAIVHSHPEKAVDILRTVVDTHNADTPEDHENQGIAEERLTIVS